MTNLQLITFLYIAINIVFICVYIVLVWFSPLHISINRELYAV